MKETKLSVGQRLVLRAPETAVASAQKSTAPNESIPSGNVIRYEVQMDDNLNQMAR